MSDSVWCVGYRDKHDESVAVFRSEKDAWYTVMNEIMENIGYDANDAAEAGLEADLDILRLLHAGKYEAAISMYSDEYDRHYSVYESDPDVWEGPPPCVAGICVNCGKLRKDHGLDGKCLFGSTTYEEKK